MTARAGMVEFFTALLSEGAVRIADPSPATPAEIESATRFLVAAEIEQRDHLPVAPPEVDTAAVSWAVTMFHRASQLLVYRELGEELIQQDLAVAGPDPTSPAAIYSVDLVFRFLPDLWRIAHAAATDDPLVKRLAEWGRAWPLSGVGIPVKGAWEPDALLSHACLRRLLVDRIIARNCLPLLADPRVRELVQSALGPYPQLAPEISRALRDDDAARKDKRGGQDEQ